MAHPVLLEKQCGSKCRSRQHVDQIISQIARLSLPEFQAYSSLCHSWSKYPDLLGRVALHIAASCGKSEILEWLLEEKKVNLSVKDTESGYTALHRAIYYGQIAAAKILIQYDSDLQVTDHEGLTPIDAAIFDRPGFITYAISEPNEVSTWGENMNSILGHHTTHKRTTPEFISEFRELGLSVKQVVVSKFHSVFLTQDGRVFTCGNGQGGRLGHGDQHFVLVPKRVDAIKKQTCVEIAAGADHTLLRMRKGLVLSCGLNTCYQLGQDQDHDMESCLTPKQMRSKFLKKKPVIGMCAGRFHSVLWTADEVLTVGLNAGQLGQPKGDKYIDHLQPVPSLKSANAIDIMAVSCSDAATACLTAKGHVFVLHEYTCRRIALRLPGIEQMVITGGSLDNHVCSDILMEKGGHELIILLKNTHGQLYVWRGSNPGVKRCRWRMKKQLVVTSMCVSDAGLLVTTRRGQAYIGKLTSSKTGGNDVIKESPKEVFKVGGDVDKQPRILDVLLKEEVEDVAPIRVPGVHRALTVACDRRGRNYAVIEALPNGSLFKFPFVSTSTMNDNIKRLMVEADEDDILHDAVIRVEDRRWPVHRYIISTQSQYFHQACQNASQTNTDNDDLNTNAYTHPMERVPIIKVEGVTPDLMDQIIQYMYTDTCQLMTPGYQVKLNLNITREEVVRSPALKNNKMEDDVVVDKQTSAFVVEQTRKKKGGKGNKESHQPKNPVKILQEAARKLGIKSLVERLNEVKCSEGVISVESPLSKAKLSFDRLSFDSLSDVTIVTEDGKEIPCHKCILASRLEYFYSMFATGWVESKGRTRLTFPVPGDILEILIDYLYTDDAQRLVDCRDSKLLYEVLILSDQLLTHGLKEMCEVALANTVTFKNVAELLELSSVYNADQLKETCQQFVAFNLSAVLESRILEVLSEETLQELTEYYRSTMPNVGYRVLTPSMEVLDQSYLDALVTEYQNPQSNTPEGTGVSMGQRSATTKKRSKRGRSVSESDGPHRIQPVISSDGSSQSRRRSRQLSVSSDVMEKVEDNVDFKKSTQQISQPTEKPTGKTAKRNLVPTITSKMKMLNVALPNDNENVPTPESPSRPLPPPSLSPTSPSTKTPTIDTKPSTPSPATASTSLRDIMKQEYHTTRQEHKKSHEAKKKETKKQEKKGGNKSPGLPKQASCPWGAVSGVVGNVVNSFRDLMLQDQSTSSLDTTTPTPTRAHKGHAAAASPSHKGWKSAPIPIPSKTPPAQPTFLKGDNPWQGWATSPTSPTLAATSPPAPFLSYSTSPPPPHPLQTPTKVNFSDILQDEMEKEVCLVRMKQKPLTLIQLEERAMQELLVHYRADQRLDDYVTVERVTKNVAATPVWHRE